MSDDLAAKPSKTALARVTGLSPARLSQLPSEVFVGDTLGAWLKRLVTHLGEVKAGRAGGTAEGKSLVVERARLAREQADRIAMENAEKRGELAPRALLEQAATRFVRQIVKVLEGVPVQLKRKAGLKKREMDIVRGEIDRIRALAADVDLDAEEEIDDDGADGT